MSYRLRSDEPFAEGMKRVMVEQVDLALEELSNPRANGGVDTAIHEARKCMKRIRSALRLYRSSLGEKRYRKENARFRTLGASLARPRESAVAVLTVDELATRFESVLRPEPFGELRAHFAEQHLVALWKTVEEDRAVRRVAKRLRRARGTLLDLEVRDTSELAWRPGLGRAYRNGRRRMREAFAEGSPEAFHEWRKQVKHLRYHLDVLRDAWQGELDRAADLLHQLSDLLGLHHDLVDLRGQLHRNPATRSTQRRRHEFAALSALIEGLRIDLEAKSQAVGERIYGRRRKAIVARVTACWVTWRETL